MGYEYLILTKLYYITELLYSALYYFKYSGHLKYFNCKRLFSELCMTLKSCRFFLSMLSTLSISSSSSHPFLWLLYVNPLALVCGTPDVFAAPAAETAAAAEGGATAATPTSAADGTAATGG